MHVQAVFSHAAPCSFLVFYLPAVPPGPCCCWGVTPCASGACTEFPVVSQMLCLSHTSAWKHHVQLLSSSLSRAENFHFFNPPPKPRNLYQLTTFGPGAEGRGPGGAGQIPSAGRYCAVVYFGSTDAIDSCVQSSGVTNSQE